MKFSLRQMTLRYYGRMRTIMLTLLCGVCLLCTRTYQIACDNYNQAVDFMMSPLKGIKITQIAPKKLLKSGTYSYSKSTLMLDYRYGLDKGIRLVSDLSEC